MLDLSSKIKEATLAIQRNRGGNGMMLTGSGKVEKQVAKLAQDMNSVASKEKTGLIASEVKAKIFNNLVSYQ